MCHLNEAVEADQALTLAQTQTYKTMEKMVQKGKTKAIGVSNFSLAEMQRLLKEASVVPASHQIELHPYLQQKAFVDWHKKSGIVITQYSPYVKTLNLRG